VASSLCERRRAVPVLAENVRPSAACQAAAEPQPGRGTARQGPGYHAVDLLSAPSLARPGQVSAPVKPS